MIACVWASCPRSLTCPRPVLQPNTTVNLWPNRVRGPKRHEREYDTQWRRASAHVTAAGGGGGSWGCERYRSGQCDGRVGVGVASVTFVLPHSLSLMPRPVVLPCFHPLLAPAPSHMGRRRRQHHWGRWEDDRLRGIARAHPVPILRGWARELTTAVSGLRHWGKIVDAACVLYAVCMLFPGALDLPALLGALEYFVSVGATRPAASISFTGVGLAVAPGAVRAALRWRYGAAASQAWRAPRRHFLSGAARQVV